MSPSTDAMLWLQVLSSIGSFLGGIGLVCAAASLLYLARQTRAGERAATASVYQSILSLGNSINDMFINQPDLYSQIFGSSTAPAGDVAEAESADPRCFFAASKWLDYFETVLVLWPAIPNNLHEAWRAYIRSHLARSVYLQHLVLETGWYGDDLKQLCREAQRQRGP